MTFMTGAPCLIYIIYLQCFCMFQYAVVELVVNKPNTDRETDVES